jgi:molybdopterin molybdotransferase
MNAPLSRDEALARVLDAVSPLASEPVALGAAAGRVLAVAARSKVDLPAFPASAMDGFAIRSVDAPGKLSIVDRIAAGRPSRRRLAAGEAMAIATGGVVPEGADSVVPIEDVKEDGARQSVSVPLRVDAGTNLRPRGGDLAAGEVIVRAGVLLNAARLGALAAGGVGEVECHRVPSVAIAVTGSELRVAGAQLEAGEIYDANGPILEAQVRSTGALATRLPIVVDDADTTRRAVEEGLAGDVLITSGGVSVGEWDFVRRSEEELGVEEIFWQVALRPGKPISFGRRGRTLVFGLPGNPVSSLVGFELFVRPALLALQGATEPGPRFRPGRLGHGVRMLETRELAARALVRVEADGVVLEPIGRQESHMIAHAAAADALVLIPRGTGELPAGSRVDYLPL